MGDLHHMDKSVAYRATLFLTHRALLAMIPAQAASNATLKVHREGCFHDDRSTYIPGRGVGLSALAGVRGGGAAGAGGVRARDRWTDRPLRRKPRKGTKIVWRAEE